MSIENNFDLIFQQAAAARVVKFLATEMAILGELPELSPTRYTRRIIQVPESLFDQMRRDEIIASCKIINDSPTEAFILTHSWSDAQRTKGHTITAHPVDLSLKQPLSSMLGRHVCGKWSPQAPYEYFVAVVTAVSPQPFIDPNSLERHEMSLKILFYRDSSGALVEPTKPIAVHVNRQNLALCLGTLTEEQTKYLRDGMVCSLPPAYA